MKISRAFGSDKFEKKAKKLHRFKKLLPKRITGYTIVEVMLVLAVSSFLLVSALVVFQGQTKKTSFDLTVSNVQSAIKANINDLINNVAYSGTDQKCQVSYEGATGTYDERYWHLDFLPGNDNPGTDSDCVTLGRAIGPYRGSDLVKTYSVVASRLKIDSPRTSSDSPGPALSTNLTDSAPTIYTAAGKDTSVCHQCIFSSNVIYTNDASNTLHTQQLVGFYRDANGDLKAYGYNFHIAGAFGYGCANDTGGVCAKKCIEDVWNDNITGGCQQPHEISHWIICMSDGSFVASDHPETALIYVDITSQGVNTRISYEGSPIAIFGSKCYASYPA
ncbi:MAG TPA: type II secretion system protein [Candidatus Saccharimonadales bacterium]|nr:type II secretion system protein [Candidatus Saccharimonadales bacterium]